MAMPFREACLKNQRLRLDRLSEAQPNQIYELSEGLSPSAHQAAKP
jgi:hypothetical protein